MSFHFMAVIDRDGGVVRAVGPCAEVLAGRRLEELVHWGDRARLRQVLEGSCGRKVAFLEYLRLVIGGAPVACALRIARLAGGDDRVFAIVNATPPPPADGARSRPARCSRHEQLMTAIVSMLESLDVEALEEIHSRLEMHEGDYARSRVVFQASKD